MSTPVIPGYLEHYAEPQTASYAKQVTQQYQHALVVPIYDEQEDCLAQVLQHQDGQNCLVIAVVNAPKDAPTDALVRTKSLLRKVADHAPVDVLLVDGVTEPFNPKAGVGLARKLGTDIATALFAQGNIESPWLLQTDADAELPMGYFSTEMPPTGAVVFAHEHHSDDSQLHQAASLYDRHMTYYVDGLTYAGSGYAYPTLGSTIAVHAQSYAAVRGYPKRNAAEDFYLLNKVAKIAGVTPIMSPRIRIRARHSHRMPFGTGPALSVICQNLTTDPSGAFYQSYHPASFELLRNTLNYFNSFANDAAVAAKPIADMLETLGFAKLQRSIFEQYHSTTRRLEVLHQWFDAGKTLRFIHLARAYYPDQPLLDTLAQQPFTESNT